jgi:hypothetical protein
MLALNVRLIPTRVKAKVSTKTNIKINT